MRRAMRLLVCGLLLAGATADAREKQHKAPAPRVRSGTMRGMSVPHYNMRWSGGRGAGGNLRAYEEIMRERMIIQQQQYMIQQQRYLMQQMQNNQATKKGKTNSTGTLNLDDPNAEPVYHHKTYNHGPVDPNFKPRSDAAK